MTQAAPPLELALRYAVLGWHVVPLHVPRGADGCSCGKRDCRRSRGKHPRSANWPNLASKDPERLRAWFSGTGSNIGIVTGKRSGIIVLDIDPEAGGEESFAALQAAHGQFPSTVEQLTGSGGRHLLFAYPGFKVGNSVKKLGPGLDVRGDGGQIVAPPSLHFSGNHYEWQPECAPWERAPAPAPEWFLDLLRAPAAPPMPTFREVVVHDVDVLRRASAYLAKMPSAISGQRGHDTTWDVVQKVVRGFSLSESDGYMLLASEYNPRCVPPWSERELRHKVSQALTASSLPMGFLLDAREPVTGAPPPPRARVPGEDDGDPSRTVPKPSRLNLRPVSELLAEQIPPTEWLISPWLETGCIAGMVAPPNLGKTLLAFYFATQVSATGKRVAIIEEEGGRRGFQKRLDRAVLACGGSVERIDFAFKPKLSLMSRQDVLALCGELVGYDLVIIDSFARVTTGVEENDAKEMGQIVAALDQIREATGATVLVIHHTGKSKWKAGEVPSLGDGRGSSALDAGLDTVLALAPVLATEHQPGIVSFTLHITKQRDEDNRVPAALVQIAMTGPRAEVTISDTKTGEVAISPAELRVKELLHLVLSSIPVEPDCITREALQSKLKRRPYDIRRAVNQLIDEHRIGELSRKRLTRSIQNTDRGSNA